MTADQSRSREADFLQGVIPVVMTPFDAEGQIDEEAFEAEAEYLIRRGARALSTGLATEIMSLDEDERRRVLQVLAKASRGRVRLIAGSGGDTAEQAIDRARAAIDQGFDALLVTPPQGLNDDQALFDYYATLAAAVPAPIIVQDAQGMTGVRLSAELIGRLSREIETVAAVKIETPPTPPRFLDFSNHAADRLSLLGGMSGRYAIDEWRRGAIGTMPGPGTSALFFFDVWDQLLQDHVAGALALFHRFHPILHWSAVDPNRFLYLEKELLRRLGIFRSQAVRAPFTRPPDLDLRELDELFELAGVASAAHG